MHKRTFTVLTGLALLACAASLTLAGDIQTDGKLVSTTSTGAPIAVSSDTRVVNLNADFLDDMDSTQFADAVHAHTVFRFKTWGPVDFALAKRDGTALVCGFPNANCLLPLGEFTQLYVPMGLEGPGTLTELSCDVRDNDPTGDIELWLHNGVTSPVGPDSTSGASSSSQKLSLTGLSESINLGSRGPSFNLQFDSSADEPFMAVFGCVAHYEQTVS